MPQSHDTPDADLVRAALKEGRGAFDQLVTRYFPLVFTIAHARMDNPETAEDLAQEAFIQAYLGLDKLRDPTMFVPWIRSITNHLACKWLAKSQHASSILSMVPFDEVVDIVPDEGQLGAREFAQAKEEHETVRQAVFELPVDQREIVMLRYFEDLSRKEIARQLGVHTTTVWRLLRNARKSMKRSLESTLREAAPTLRASQRATTRTLGLIAATSALSGNAKAALVSAMGGQAWAAVIVQSAATGASATTAAASGKVFLGGLVTKTQAILVAMVVVLGTTGIVLEMLDEGKPPDGAVVTPEPISSSSRPSDTNPMTEEKPLIRNGDQLSKVTTVVVPALTEKGKEWIDTGLRPSIDEIVFFRATGMASVSVGNTRYDPNGNVSAGPARLTTLRDGLHLHEDAPESSLVGKIGEKGTPFLVGASRVIRASGDGTLFLGFNDSYTGFQDNSGEFRAYVYRGNPQSDLHRCQLNLMLLSEASECAPPTMVHIITQGDSIMKQPTCPSGGTYTIDIPSGSSVCSHHEQETSINPKNYKILFDDFDGSLGLDWEIEHENKSHYSLEKNPGALTITTEKGSYKDKNTSYKNFFLLPINAQQDDMVQITTCLTNFNPNVKYQQAGLFFWNDSDNLIKWGPQNPKLYDHEFVYLSESEGQRRSINSMYENKYYKRTWLRMIKRGNRYALYVSYDGENFTQFTNPPTVYPKGFPRAQGLPMKDGELLWGNGEVAKVGFYAMNCTQPSAPEIDAAFEFFKVEILPNDTIEKNTSEGSSTKGGKMTIEPASLPADSAFSIFPDLKTEAGEVVFMGKYEHLSRGESYSTMGEMQLLKSDRGAITAISTFPNSWGVVATSGNEDHRLTTYRAAVQRDGDNYLSMLKIHDDRIVSSFSKPNTAPVVKEMVVPLGALYDPNSWPDSYCTANILLRGFDLKAGDTKEFKAYDVDVAGTGYSGYTLKVEHKGKTEVNVPAGVFWANHVVLTQITSGDTWFEKRDGQRTEFWVLDNYVIVRILRHREPYELKLASCTDVEILPGYVTTVVVPTRFKKEDEWVDTGLRALENEILYLQGIGNASNSYVNYSDASGIVSRLAKVEEIKRGSYLHSDSPEACLVGKIGEEGTPFTVGKSRVIRVSGGKLFLGYNDSSTWTHDNSGSLTAYVYRGESQTDIHKCQMHLLILQEAKARWASDNDPNTLPTWEDLTFRGNYLKKQPVCPFGGTYTIGLPRELSTCSHIKSKVNLVIPKTVAGWTTPGGQTVVNDVESGTGIVSNPSFENEVNGSVPPWQLITSQGSCGFGIDTKITHDGARSVKISSKNGGGASWAQTLTVVPYTIYSASCWIKTQDVTGDADCGAALRILPSSPAGAKAITQTQALTGTNEWREVKVRFNTGSVSSINIECLFGGSEKCTGKVWFDNIEFNPVPKSGSSK